MREAYAKLLERELSLYTQIQQVLKKYTPSCEENLDQDIERLYKDIFDLQREQSKLMRILMAADSFKQADDNKVFMCFVEKLLCLKSLNEEQRWDCYSLIYKLSTVKPGRDLLQYFIAHQQKNPSFKIPLKAGSQLPTIDDDGVICFPLHLASAPLWIIGSAFGYLLPEVRHISLGHELIHLYHAAEKIDSKAILGNWGKIAAMPEKLLYCVEPYSAMITELRLDERLTIEGGIRKDHAMLFTENKLRAAFKLGQRIGWWRSVAFDEKERVKDLFTLIEAHRKRWLSPEDFLRLTTPPPDMSHQISTSKPPVLLQEPIRASSGLSQIVPYIGAFFNTPRFPTIEELWSPNPAPAKMCTLL